MRGTKPMRLVGDLGGTHCRLAIADETGAITAEKTLRAANFSNVEAAIECYLSEQAANIDSVCLAVAGPTQSDTMVMTNLSWHTNSLELNARFGFRKSAFINDFEAIALSLPALAAGDLLAIGCDTLCDLDLPISLMGPGTGLGVAQLIPSAGRSLAIATEGGHTALQAETDIEFDIFDYWRRKGVPLSRETFLSGPGLYRIYEALCSIRQIDRLAENGSEVGKLAGDGDPLAAAALDVFLGLLGSAAGDQALACGSRGGIVLAGGILPRIQPQLLASNFRVRFENKLPMRDYLRAIPTNLIMHTNPGLVGAALYPL